MNVPAEILQPEKGFEGAVSGLALADILQMKNHSSFTGCLIAITDGEQGRLFFRDGAIIHAELPQCEGEEACYRILSWQGGQFKVEHKISTARTTISKPLNFLLIEACRRMDEAREQGNRDSSTPTAKTTASPAQSASLLRAFRKQTEVQAAVMIRPQGGSRTFKTATEHQLATDGELLTLIGRRIGQLLSTGPLRKAAAQSTTQQIVAVCDQNDQDLYVSYTPDLAKSQIHRLVQSAFSALKKV